MRYYRRNCDRRPGRRKKKRQAGVYAGLALLGIYERCTPALSATVGMFAALLGSFDEAQRVLAEQGHVLDIKTVRLIAYRMAERVRLVQQTSTYAGQNWEGLAGRRVIVSTDGGRIRLREKKRGPRTAKKRTRYKGAWREPKLFIIYVVDEEGRQSHSFAPLIDGTLGGPDMLFAMLERYLLDLDIQAADQLLFISDGATWIWNRVPVLLTALNLASHNIHLLIDFYHAVQHLNEAASARKGWTAKERKRWLNKQRKRLIRGEVDQVIEAIRSFCKGRNSKKIRTQLNYFIKHQKHMAYAHIASLNLPIGSGAMESAIRRVVNLRLKGPSIFWCKPNAEAMLLLRAFYKTGRWQQLKSWAFSPAYVFSR